MLNPAGLDHVTGALRPLNHMKSFIQNLSAPAEFCLVMMVGFAPIICCLLWQFVQSERVWVSNNNLLKLDITELTVLVAVLLIGKIRGWSLATFGFSISWKGTGVGILLFIATTAMVTAVGIWAHIIHSAHPDFTAVELTVPFILLHSIVNPVFEEVMESGYFIHSLQRFGMWPAIFASALFRACYHAWMGIGALSIFALGMIFGLSYWRWRQLWPLVVAHSLCDILGLLYIKSSF